MKTIKLVLVLLLATSAYSQVAPKGGKKVMKVTNKFHGEYDKEVVSCFAKAPRDYYMKKLPKKLAKYGFTNVKITKLGSVSYDSKVPFSRVDIAIAQINTGSSFNTAYRTATTKVDTSKFQVNFTSDQGSFKVRLSMLVGPRYIIKENVNVVATK